MMQKKDNISYEDYLELVKQEISVRTGKRVQLQTIRKNNRLVFDGLTILADGMDAVAARVGARI